MTDSHNSSGTDYGGRWGRAPFKPDDLKAQFGTVDDSVSDRLDVTCPGCGKNWYPVSSCCIKGGGRTSSPFCPECGTDFRADTDAVMKVTHTRVSAQTDDALDKLHQCIRATSGLSIDNEVGVYRETEGEQACLDPGSEGHDD